MADEKWQGKTVLIVDDSEEIRRQLREVYLQLGLEVTGEAENGVVALEAIDKREPDLVSLDIIMPEMDGIECFRLIKSRGYKAECLFVSVLSSDNRVHEAYREQIEGFRFVRKPATAEKVDVALEMIFPREGGEESSLEQDNTEPAIDATV